jgi:hypothetical protein
LYEVQLTKGCDRAGALLEWLLPSLVNPQCRPKAGI